MSKWYLYVLECRDKSLYCGITTDISRRVNEHNFSTRGAKYTRSRRPVKIVYVTRKLPRSCAMTIEWRFKKLTVKKKRKIVYDDVNIKTTDYQHTEIDNTLLAQGFEAVVRGETKITYKKLR